MPEMNPENRVAAEQGALHIVSLIVHARSPQVSTLSQWIDTRSDLEIHLGNEEGKLVVVLETPDLGQINEIIETIKDQPGVLNVVMVYHEEIALSDVDDVLVEKVAGSETDTEQPVKIVGEL
ncbi:chaperone NapD [Microbulbifer bruguierae]|uniref:Chaperone NapD n=1 Tax=Microbulbifer bruguierae TaxID=3029061 RepID=A0ABY8NA26_9GAMM|nr:chaperone NapD [Microbulbifer bruguierae]WGL15758.1 chaperone NapD [Microbulbifer bruguierae]